MTARIRLDDLTSDQLDALYDERDQLLKACRDVRRFLTVLHAALPGGMDVYLTRIKLARRKLDAALDGHAHGSIAKEPSR